MQHSYNYAYPARIQEVDGRHVVTFYDFEGGATDGATREGALHEAVDLLDELLAMHMAHGLDIPRVINYRRHQPRVAPSVLMACKVALYEAMRAKQITATALARLAGVDEKEVRRWLNPRHATKVATLESALALLGRRVGVVVEAA